ncbi:DUF3551 domain-containing protein [Bradyrhizobium sp. LLZ17]|uniref:DUF3551 domain-containing protein n=1 Tax=Bradyrhizobium sp. LLZ17 TaxID=3239388 RepID=A0AB39XR86_9BRAD
MRTLVLTILTLGIVFAAGHAQAQTYDPAFPVCLHVVRRGGGSYYRCAYHTIDQCRATANGQTCDLNPYYAGTKGAAKRINPRYHRQVGSSFPVPAAAGYHARAELPIHGRAGSCNHGIECYYGACLGYAPGEKELFVQSVRSNL